MKNERIALSGLLACMLLGGVALTNTGCSSTRYHRSTGAYLDDKALTVRAKSALFRDPLVSGFDVDVTSYRGEVQLSGYVDTPEQKQRAAEVVRQIDGVQMVVNNLEVKPGPAPTTAVGSSGAAVQGGYRSMNQPPPSQPNQPEQYQWAPVNEKSGAETQMNDMNRNTEPAPAQNINAPTAPRAPGAPAQGAGPGSQSSSVSGADMNAPARPENLEIEAANGQATLRGSVTSQEQKQAIERQLRQIPGINQVNNELEVRSPSNP